MASNEEEDASPSDVAAQIRWMLAARGATESKRCRLRGGTIQPRRRLSEAARVVVRSVLNAPVLSEISGGKDRQDDPSMAADIVVHAPGRATAHTVRRCGELGIEVWDRRYFELQGGFQSHAPVHELVALPEHAARFVQESMPGLTLDQMPHIRVDDPAARYFGAEVGELWQCDWADSGPDAASPFPPRRVVPADDSEGQA